MGALASALSRLLGDVVTFKFMAHGAHWDVEGPNFPQYHALFGAIYDDADESVDPIAENIRKIGAVPPSSLADFVAVRSLDDYPATTDAIALLSHVADANDALLRVFAVAFDAATAANEQGIANFIAERLDAHEKWRWQLRATLGQPAVTAPATPQAAPVTAPAYRTRVADAVRQSVDNTFNS